MEDIVHEKILLGKGLFELKGAWMPYCEDCCYYCKHKSDEKGFCVVVNPGFRTNVKKDQRCPRFEKIRKKKERIDNRSFLDEWRILI